MKNLDQLIFGYYRVQVASEDYAAVADLLVRNGVAVSFDRDFSLIVCARSVGALRSLLDGKIKYEISTLKGLYGFLHANRKRYGVFCAALLVFLMYFWLSGFVWDVRVEGCEPGKEESIIEELAECGLAVGSRWRKIDKNEVEIKLLSISENVSWLNVNRRGAVAYVSVADKIVHSEEEEKEGFASVVATRDCIIEEITVKSGVAMVRVGDSVKKGEVLISGVIPTELGGGYCYAEGTVIGRFTDVVSAEVPMHIIEKVYGERVLQNAAIKILGFRINIFKSYGNLENNCDIIEKKEDLCLLGDKKLPISLLLVYSCPYEERTATVSSDEMVKNASSLLRERIARLTDDCDIVRISTNGEFRGDYYRMSARLVCRASIAQISEFEVQRELK